MLQLFRKSIAIRHSFYIFICLNQTWKLLSAHLNQDNANIFRYTFSMIDEKAGEVPVAFVVRTNGFTTTEEEIKQFVSKQVRIFSTIKLGYLWSSVTRSHFLRTHIMWHIEWFLIKSYVILLYTGGVLQENISCIFCWCNSEITIWKDSSKGLESKNSIRWSSQISNLYKQKWHKAEAVCVSLQSNFYLKELRVVTCL